MLRTLARRGASLLLATALLGGGLALGGGTASAEDLGGDTASAALAAGVSPGDVFLLALHDLLIQAGSSETGCTAKGCTPTGSDAMRIN
ncbi:hypothetical protein [Rhodococcus sp. NPDC058481]|uniref:hypothetical protein n=1 Tax=unclassified Rhodococcus (in: high G+C Gram-positive bacteria) TaxID=192944 RepID=UPI00365D628C